MKFTPTLLLVYNRPKTTKKLINALSHIKPRKIFVSSDGPKNNEDKILCDEVKDIISKINWKCIVKKKYNKKNLGCKESVSQALNWFFKINKFGIILEDDCIPNKDFFNFSDIMLKKYYNNGKIGAITGNNFLKKKIKIKNKYFYSKYANCWGWATWRSRWKLYEKKISFWPKFKKTKKWENFFASKEEKTYWEFIFDKAYKNQDDSWAYPWTLSLWKNDKLTVTPSKNLVKNIGKNSSRSLFNFLFKSYKAERLSLQNIKFYKEVKLNNEVEKVVFRNHFKKNILFLKKFVYLSSQLFNLGQNK